MADQNKMDTDEKSDNSSLYSTKTTSSEDGDIYEVEKIIGISKTKGKPLYKVRWQGYDPSWDTWEPIENLGACLNLVEDFEAENKNIKGQHTMVVTPGKLDKEVFFLEESSQDTIIGNRSPSQASHTSTSSSKSSDKKPTWKYVSSSDDEADTLKDKFWRDLDQGKVNIFGNDMYSKVKGEGARKSRPESFKEMYQNKPLVQSTDAAPIKKKRNSSDRKSVESTKSTASRSSVDSRSSSSSENQRKVKKEKVKIKKEKKSTTQQVTASKYPVATKVTTEIKNEGGINIKKEPLDSYSTENDVQKAASSPTVKYLPDGTVDTLKDSFFRDLEQGKINIFEGEDMYSRVKAGGGRAARPQSFTDMFKNKPLVQTESSAATVKKKRRSTEKSEGSDSKSVANVKCVKSNKKGSGLPDSNVTWNKDSDVESCISSVSSESGIPKLKIQINRNSDSRKNSVESSFSVDSDSPPVLTEFDLSDSVNVSSIAEVPPVKDLNISPTIESKVKKKKKKRMKEVPEIISEVPGASKDMVSVVGKCKNVALHADHPQLVKCTVALTRLPSRFMQQCSVFLSNGKLDWGISSLNDAKNSKCTKHNKSPQKLGDVSSDDDVHHHSKDEVLSMGCGVSTKSKAKLPVTKAGKLSAATGESNQTSKKSMHGKVVGSQGSVNNSKVESSGLSSSSSVKTGSVLLVNKDIDEVTCISSDVSEQKLRSLSAGVTTKQQDSDKSKSSFKGNVQKEGSRKRKVTGDETEAAATSDSPKKGKLGWEESNSKNSQKESSVHDLSTLEVEEFSVDFNSDEIKNSSITSIDCHQNKKVESSIAKTEGTELLDISSHVEDVSSLGSPQHGPHSNYSVQSCDSGVDISNEKSFLMDGKDGSVIEPGSPAKLKVDDDDYQKPSTSSTASMGDQGEKQLDFIEFDLAEIEPSLYFNTQAPKVDIHHTDLSTSEFRHAVKKNEFEKVRAALNKRKYDLEQPDANGVSLIMICALNGFDGMLELLVRNGANINAETKSGVTALMMSCEQGLRCTAELLLALGAFMNRTTANSGETALVKCIKRGHVHIVKSLLNYGCNFNATSSYEHGALKYATTYNRQEIKELLETHIERVTTEFGSQVKLTLNNTAKIQSALFPLQCLSLREGDRFRTTFKHELQPTNQGIGMLLFIAHARVSGNEAKCRFYGPCAVTSAVLNGTKLHPLTEEGNFVMSFCPLHNGRNELEIHTVSAPSSRAKLIVCAYQAQLIV